MTTAQHLIEVLKDAVADVQGAEVPLVVNMGWDRHEVTLRTGENSGAVLATLPAHEV